MLTDYKITETDIYENDMYNAKNQWVNEATDLKNKFDALPKKIIEKYNQLIDAMEGESGYLHKTGGAMSGNILGNNSSNLGTSESKWKDLYLAGDARIDGALYLSSGAVMHNTVPETSNTYDLGSSSRTWRNLYIGAIITASGGGIKNPQAGQMIFNANSEANNAVFFGVRNSVWTLCPHVSGKVALGNSNFKWGQIYSTNSTISTSDENEKNSIKALDKEKAAEFIKGVNPVSYKFNDGTSGRTHWGMISQDIEKLMNEKGMSSLDFAGFIKSPKTQRVETGKDENGDPIYEDKVIEGEYTYGLRYEEFIAPMIATIQYQQQKIEEQGKQIEDLTKRIEALEGGK